MITGHTDSRPLEGKNTDYRNNWDLSSARALTVLDFFLEAGVPSQNLMIAGYGANDPVTDNRKPQSRHKNRRIEIEFLPHPDELPWLRDDAGETQPATTPSPTE
jgi:chemotaxis protein MotB